MNKCKICGSDIDMEWYEDGTIRSLMKSHNFCYNCAFWQEKLEIANKDTIISNNCRFQCSLIEKPRRGYLGYGGGDFYFQMLDNQKDLRHYNNCWLQGEVPTIWQKKIPNNAIQISKSKYEELIKLYSKSK